MHMLPLQGMIDQQIETPIYPISWGDDQWWETPTHSIPGGILPPPSVGMIDQLSETPTHPTPSGGTSSNPWGWLINLVKHPPTHPL